MAIYIPSVRPPRQPYALDTPRFAFVAMATFAAKASLGGLREIGLAAYVTARMAEDTLPSQGLTVEARRTRAANARKWLSTLAIAEPTRRAFIELVAATEADPQLAATAVRRVMEVTAVALDSASRAELERLARDLESQPIGRT
jgi:hypothetical protein